MIVEDINVKNLLVFLLSHRYNFVHMLILGLGLGCALNSFYSEGAFLVVVFLDDSHLNVTRTFSYRVVQALETDQRVVSLNLNCLIVFHLQLLALNFQEVFASTNLISFSGGKSFKQRLWF